MKSVSLPPRMGRRDIIRNGETMKIIFMVGAILLLLYGCASNTKNPEVLSVNNDEVITLPVPSEQEAGKPCRVPGDCGIDGCIQQNRKGGINGETSVCNGRRYACTVGLCEVEDNIFYDAYCTEFGCQELCGNSACEVKYGENDKNCLADCVGKGLVFKYAE